MPTRPQSHSESVAALLRSFSLIAFTTDDGRVGIARDSMFALFGELGETSHYDKVPKLARLECIADNIDWDWAEADGENDYLTATFRHPFVIEGALYRKA